MSTTNRPEFVVTAKTLATQVRYLRTVRSIGALAMREMSTTYGKSPGGYFWSVVEPVAGIALLSVVFSIALRSPPLGVNFQIYFATGFLPFIFYREIETKCTGAIRFSRTLLLYPGVTYVDSIIARAILTTLTQMLIFYLVMGGVLAFWETRTSVDPTLVLSSLGAALLLGVGVGTLNCYLTAVAPVWQHVWSVLNRPLIILSSVIFLHDNIPEPWKSYLEWNPLVHIVGQMRCGFFPNYRGEYIDMLYPCGIGLLFLVVGLVLLNRFNRDIVNAL